MIPEFTEEELKKWIDEQRKTHKKKYTDLEIIVPVAYESIFDKYVVTRGNEEPMRYRWCMVPYEEANTNFKSVYEDLRDNFEREQTDLVYLEPWKECYFLTVNLLKSGFQCTEKWRWVGCVCISKHGVIDWAWVHPYLRCNGFMFQLLLYYSCNVRPIALQPPVTKSMQHCLAKVTKTILEDQRFFYLWLEILKRYFQEEYQCDSLDDFSEEQLVKIWSGYQSAVNTKQFQEANKEERKKLFYIGLDTMKMLFKNPELCQEISKNEHVQEYIESCEERKRQMIQYGFDVDEEKKRIQSVLRKEQQC